MPKADSNIPLPPAKPRHSPESHMKMSRRLLAHSREQLALEDRLQASEKAWGATAHALKAVAIQRGWNHRKHTFNYAIASQLAAEQNRPDFVAVFGRAENQHRNFYNNTWFLKDIRAVVDAVERMVNDLDKVRQADGLPYKVPDEEAQDRLEMLRGKRPRIGEVSPNGFVVEHRAWDYKKHRGKRAAGGQANTAPGSQSRIEMRPGKTINQPESGTSGREGNAGRHKGRNRGKNRGGKSTEVHIRLD